jgi:hypothetical protein
MKPFETYPGAGKVLLGPTPGETCRRGYGRLFIQMTGQTCCAYCELDFAAAYENWLQMAIDHVVPRNVCASLSIPALWYEDCTNKVLACAACNGFDNRYKPPASDVCPASLEEFHSLRDRIFIERKLRIAERHRRERKYFASQDWTRNC